jgi:hypothetical protein
VLLAAIAFLLQTRMNALIVFAGLVVTLVLEFFGARLFIRRLTGDVPAFAGGEPPRRVSVSEHEAPRKGEGPEPI